MFKFLFGHKPSKYLEKYIEIVRENKENDIEETIKLDKLKEQQEQNEKKRQILKSAIEVILGIAMVVVAISTYNTQKNLGKISNNIQSQNTQLNEILTKNSNEQLYLAKTQTTFQVLDTLNKAIGQKGYDTIKDNLQQKVSVDKKQLQNYLNNFENVYMSCHRGLVPKDDIKYSFEYLLENICSNKDVLGATKNGYGGLKKLCGLFFPESELAKGANMNTNNCGK